MENGTHRSSLCPFSGRIKCGDCGGWYGSKVWYSTDKYKRIIWQCNQKYKKETKCTTPIVDDEAMKALFVKAANIALSEKNAAIMKLMNAKCDRWAKETGIGFSIYGTPIESTTYKFAKCLQRRFGIVEGVTDKGYITNSYHVKVTEKINAFEKLAFEAQFQDLSKGAATPQIPIRFWE